MQFKLLELFMAAPSGFLHSIPRILPCTVDIDNHDAGYNVISAPICSCSSFANFNSHNRQLQVTIAHGKRDGMLVVRELKLRRFPFGSRSLEVHSQEANP